ncbi:unnamed protein product [Ceratitis capitata]|uniref:(Mediterranean fruit fly) hypothetical protein n=1 Tax=Ceratitis capitata TaxID=7213 RepID=A0A811UZK9_CERCA|nr:unnamed protein product [Ceratitis capitata]
MRPPHEERKIMELNSDQTNVYNYGIDTIISRQAFHKKSVCRSQAITLQIEEESRRKPPVIGADDRKKNVEKRYDSVKRARKLSNRRARETN